MDALRFDNFDGLFSPVNYDAGLIRINNQSDVCAVVVKKHRTPPYVAEWSGAPFGNGGFALELMTYKVLEAARRKDPSIDWFPRLLGHNGRDLLVLQYVGRPLGEGNLPQNYKEQVEKIFSDLASIGLAHHDFFAFDPSTNDLCCEFTALGGKVYLVDYGWGLSGKPVQPSGPDPYLRSKEDMFKYLDQFLDNSDENTTTQHVPDSVSGGREREEEDPSSGQ